MVSVVRAENGEGLIQKQQVRGPKDCLGYGNSLQFTGRQMVVTSIHNSAKVEGIDEISWFNGPPSLCRTLKGGHQLITYRAGGSRIALLQYRTHRTLPGR